MNDWTHSPSQRINDMKKKTELIIDVVVKCYLAISVELGIVCLISNLILCGDKLEHLVMGLPIFVCYCALFWRLLRYEL